MDETELDLSDELPVDDDDDYDSDEDDDDYDMYVAEVCAELDEADDAVDD